MLQIGDYIIARDRDIADEYRARVVKVASATAQNPFVRVLSIVRYPIQHAVLWSDVPSENPPLPYGALERLEFVRRCDPCEEDKSVYDASLREAITAALAEAKTPGERSILLRHQQGEYGKRRITCPQ